MREWYLLPSEASAKIKGAIPPYCASRAIVERQRDGTMARKAENFFLPRFFSLSRYKSALLIDFSPSGVQLHPVAENLMHHVWESHWDDPTLWQIALDYIIHGSFLSLYPSFLEKNSTDNEEKSLSDLVLCLVRSLNVAHLLFRLVLLLMWTISVTQQATRHRRWTLNECQF